MFGMKLGAIICRALLELLLGILRTRLAPEKAFGVWVVKGEGKRDGVSLPVPEKLKRMEATEICRGAF